MTSSTIIGFVNNTALLLALVLIYDVLALKTPGKKYPALGGIPIGIILGCIGVGIMMNPWEFLPGIVFDTRSILLSVVGFFFGTIPMLVCILITSGYRLFIGGIGAWTGVAVIITSGGVGLIWRYWQKKKLDNISNKGLYAMGLTTHVLMLLWMLTLPQSVAFDVLSKISIPVLLLFPLGTVILGKLFINRFQRIQSIMALKESEAKHRHLYETMTQGVVIQDATGKIMEANQTACEILGLSLDQMLGKTPYDPRWRLIHEDGSPCDPEEMPSNIALRTGKPVKGFHCGIYIPEKDEYSWIVIGSVPRFKEGETKPFVTMTVFTDITEDVQNSKEKDRIEKQLIQSQKMESIGTLAGGVAHDYNNISSIIIGYTELALEQVKQDDPLHEDLMEILTAAKRSTEITRQLLAFARKQTIAPKVLNLNDSIGNMLKMIRRLIGEDIDLAWLPGAKVWPVKIDPSQVDQLLANLVVNARDAIADVGKVTIETKKIRFDEDYCADHAGFIPGEFVLLAVSDDGSGIAPDILNKIFEPFFTTKRQGKGTGLGLATVYGIVKQNNGFINIYSEPKKGTTIKIYLPRHEGQVVEAHSDNNIEIPVSLGETVLLVEDDGPILKLGKRMLEELGYRVLAATSPSEASKLAEEQADEINLLITDVIMPEMNGRDLSEHLESLYPNLKTLFMSGYTANVIAHRGVLDDNVFFISKPFSKKDMAVKVREVLDETKGSFDA